MRNSTFSRSLLCFLSMTWAAVTYAELQVVPLAANDDANVMALVQKIAGPNVTVKDGLLKPRLIHANPAQLGLFTGGREWVSVADYSSKGQSIGIPEGLVLSTGNAVDVQAGIFLKSRKKVRILQPPTISVRTTHC
ncbi:MAG: hypothetical protein JKY01_00775 [Pseudomonadales bacterium]|nr:hypothetical protein [Pseudomonadales bacterium]